VLGGLFLGHPEVGVFDENDERTVIGIATHAALAFDHARLYESEHLARTAAEAAGARLALLSDATRALTSSLELEVVLGELARLVTPAIADLCLIELVEPDGSLCRAASATAPALGDGALGLERLRSRPGDAPDPALEALRSGRIQVVSDGSLGAVVVPLAGRREPLGVLWLVTDTAPGNESDPDTLTFAEELARRASIAVENARLFARQRSVSETLQQSLLPERLPDIPGLSTAARYLPGGPDVDVGGDWYDVMQLPGGGIGLALGDVVGRGERAAALMGQLRNAVRAYAFEGQPPAEVVEGINGLLLDAGSEHMATMLYGVLDAESGELRLVNAGHPPPLLVAAEGGGRFLEGASGPPVGALPTARYVEHRTILAPGETLLFYSDGLVEDRSTPLGDGLARLRETAAGAPRDLDGFCSHVLRRTIGATACDDDVALLAVQVTALGSELHLQVPSQPGVLAPLRATMRRWLAQAGASDLEAYELLTACGEACTNAIRHASGPLRSDFEVDAAVVDGAVEIVVRDRGSWRQPRGDVGGRGLPIIEAYVDELDVRPGAAGTEVRMRRRLTLDREAVR
jgi:serine phosphatase RsbU (regulator of sigma subunit)